MDTCSWFRVIWIRVCLSFHPEVFLELAQFFQEISMELGAKIRQGQIFFKKFVPQNGESGPKIGFFLSYWNIYLLIFSEFGLQWNFVLCFVLHKPYIWEKSGSCDTVQSALGQSDCRIKSSFSLEQWWKNLIFCMLIQTHGD